MCLVVLWICLLLQQCLEGTDPETSPLPASEHPPTYSPAATSATTFSAMPCFLDLPTAFFCGSLLIADQP